MSLRLLVVVLAAPLVLPLSTLAQQAELPPQPARALQPAAPPAHAHEAPRARAEAEPPRHRHATDLGSAETIAHLQAYHALRAAGQLPAPSKAAVAHAEGDTADFYVFTELRNEGTSPRAQRPFKLMRQTDLFELWVHLDELNNQNVTVPELEALEERLLQTTPEGSYDENRGIIAINNDVFGEPPDVDGNGRVTVLMYDIENEGGGGPGQGTTLGLVWSGDLNPNATNGNTADVLYLDSKEGTNELEDLQAIAAHEYTHLIHFGLGLPNRGFDTFLGEGLAEYAMVINGYPFWRTIRYLDDPAEHLINLTEWRGAVRDYERAGLFTTYIGDRIGVEATGELAAISVGKTAAASYEDLLTPQGLDLEEVVEQFHIANFVNDRALGEGYGYIRESRNYVTAAPTAEFDGEAETQKELARQRVASGAARYLTWTNVSDLTVELDIHADIADVLREGQRQRLRTYAVLERTDGTISIVPFEVGADEPVVFEGRFLRATVAAIHVFPARDEVLIDVTAAWAPLNGNVETEEVVYDDGTPDITVTESESSLSVGGIFGLGQEARQASRFTVPEGGRLARVSVAPVYENFFGSDLPANAPRDFRLHVWAVAPSGAPGDELFATDVTDRGDDRISIFRQVEEGDTTYTATYDFLTVDLADRPGADVLEDLPEQVFVGLTNLGDDANHLLLSTSAYDGDNVSYLYLPNFGDGGGWAAFDNITSNGEAILENQALPIRAEFVVGTTTTSDEGIAELPEAITLGANYPNPFNPSTTVTFALPQPTDVRVDVYDALGRHVATVADGFRTAGAHSVRIDAGAWASGVYFYTLTAGAERQTRRMLLVK